MKKYIFIIGLLFLQSCSQQVDISQIQLRNDLYFKVNTDKPFSGTIVSKYENGQIENSIKIKNGKPHGESKFFYENGQVKNTTPFKNGKKNGEQKEFFRNGSISEVANYKNGTLDGPRNSYYQNGQIKIKSINKNGNTEGLISGYFENGAIAYERFYKNKFMLWEKDFDLNGDLLVDIEMIDGKKNGKEKRYIKSERISTNLGEVEKKFNLRPQVSHDLVWVNGLKTGIQKSYNPYGAIKKVETYKDGKLNGPQLERLIFKQYDYEFLLDRKVGYSEFEFRDKISYRTTDYVNGIKSGKSIAYDNSDRVISITNYSNNKRNGEYLHYYEEDLWIKGNYKDGNKQGLWEFFALGGETIGEIYKVQIYENGSLKKEIDCSIALLRETLCLNIRNANQNE